MRIDDENLKQILLAEHYITPEDIASAKAQSMPFAEYLLSRGLITKNLLGQAAAESLHFPYSNLNSSPPSREEVLQIPEEVAKKFRIVLSSRKKQSVIVASDNPREENLLSTVKKIFPLCHITIAYALPEDIDENFVHYRKPLATRFSKIIQNQERIAPKILEEIFEDAFTFRASDIHFEPHTSEVIVRFRVDGVLHEAGHIAREHYENLLNRIKVQSRLRIDEHFSAQDGSLRYEKDGRIFDIRTSIIPTVEGEKAALRILNAYVENVSLGNLGLTPEYQNIIEKATRKPFGMIIATGPTGSGKTTTLYAMIRTLNRPETNITTIEDPVEYKMPGVNQIQVNPQTNLTFAKGLRSIVRQDPDVILVGEIRDEETGQIAVNAALTGHLLLSTFHANDAATSIPRLLDMGVEPFLLASTLQLILSQRLVRTICEHCRYSVEMSRKELSSQLAHSEYFFPRKTLTFYRGKGCDVCSYSGYHGRIALFELIAITPEMRDLILKTPAMQEIRTLARSQGSRSIFEDGLEKVKSGITTLEELLRVAEQPISKNHKKKFS